MSEEAKQVDTVEPDVVVLEKENYARMMSTIRALVVLSLSLGLALTVVTVKLLNARRGG